MDTETGDEETDGETTETTGTEDEPESDRDCPTPTNPPKISEKKIYHYETLMKGMTFLGWEFLNFISFSYSISLTDFFKTPLLSF